MNHLRLSGTLTAALLVLLGAAAEAQTVPFESSNLPIIVIEPRAQTIPDEPKITADMTVYDAAYGRNGLTGQNPAYDGSIGIELRGNGALNDPKQQFGIELRSAAGDDTNAVMLGMPSEEDWVLCTAYTDKSLMRNALGMSIASSTGRYSSRTRFCELVLDGDYRGVYLFMERIKRGGNRVAIAKLEPKDSAGTALTGGYIFKLDPAEGLPFEGWTASFDSLGYFAYLYHYPNRVTITALQRDYIATWFAAFETTMRGAGYADPIQGYRRIADVPSFIDHMLVQELSYNGDGYQWSTYFSKERDDRGGKLSMGPAWDLASAFGNCWYGNGGLTTGWRIHSERRPFWWYRMLADTLFLRDLHARWRTLRSGAWATPPLFARIDSIAALLDEAQQRNFRRWDILGRWVAPNTYVGRSYADEVAFLKAWLGARLAWIDAHIDSLSATPERVALPAHHEIHSVSPNPANATVQVHFVTAAFADADISVLDLLGRTVSGRSLHLLPSGEHIEAIDLGSVPAGTYMLRLSVAGATMDSRILQVVR
jgi:hypothetical protein